MNRTRDGAATLGPAFLFWAALLAAGCGDGSAPQPRAGDAGVVDAGADGPPAQTCQVSGDCPSAYFCGLASKTCISAVAQVATGAKHTCALHRSGQVSCWGLGEALNAGGAYVVPPTFWPVATVGDPAPQALAAGTDLTCALSRAGHVRCWGELGYDVEVSDGVSLAGVTAIALGPNYGCALAPQGVHCWGQNDLGQLARPLETTASALALLSQPGARTMLATGLAAVTYDGGQICAWGHNGTKLITSVDGVRVYPTPQCAPLPGVTALSLGADHACVSHADGSFACWGERYYGQLGTGGTDADTADIDPYGATTTLPGGVAVLVTGASHTCALSPDAQVHCFGRNNLGQIGPGAGTAAEEVRTPAPVTGFPGQVVALASGSSAQHTCALLADGSVACWGLDDAGQLGDGVTTIDDTRISHGPVPVRW